MIARNLAPVDSESEFGQLSASPVERLVWSLSDWRQLPQSWRQKLRKRFARRICGPFDVNHQGMKFRLYPAENYCDRVIFGRKELPEPVEHEWLTDFAKPGMVFVDIGANVGSYSVFVSTRALKDLTLIAFEPHPRTFEKLRFNLRANGLALDHVFNCGVGPERTELELWSDGGSNIGHTSMLREGTANAKVSVQAPVIPLLDALRDADIQRIDLLKIDIEGFEDRALAPFFDIAPKSLLPKTLLIEVAHDHLWERDLHGLLKNNNYEEKFRTKENRLLIRLD